MSTPRLSRPVRWLAATVLAATIVPASAAALPAGATPTDDAAAPDRATSRVAPRVVDASAFDVSQPLSELARTYQAPARAPWIVPEQGPFAPDNGFSGDGAVQEAGASDDSVSLPLANFEGVRSRDNFEIYGFEVNPPDPVGDVGPDHYVEMVNLVFGVYTKSGTPIIAPTAIGALWAGFAVQDCTDASGDPIVVYDQLADRWILTQFTTRGFDDPTLPFYNCVAVSTSGDPAGSYYRYAFTTGSNFPDYPKYGVWTNAYVVTTREFGPTDEYGIGVYALQKNRMLQGKPAKAVGFYLDGNDPKTLRRVGDGLLPADLDGTRTPERGTSVPLMGTQDDDYIYGAKSDAANLWDLDIQWQPTTKASVKFTSKLDVASFDSNFPCGPDPRDCLPQPGINDKARYLDILSYRQRPTWRLAYRDFGKYESLVTNQSVEARRGVAGVRWYEIRRKDGEYSVHQQGTYAPNDGIHRWMGSITQDRRGNMALAYSVVNGQNVFPGIRYTGRRATDPLGKMTLSESIIVSGTGVQRTENSRWGDYSSMNIDPNDCTFWYVNEYYTEEGEEESNVGVGWQTRIASFDLPGSGCQ